MVETPEEAFSWTRSSEDAPDDAQIIEMEFEEGVPVAIDGKKMTPVQLIRECNRIAGMHDVRDIREEAEIILKHGCTLEDIEYYLPGFHEPLKRKVGLSRIEEMERFLKKLEMDSARMESLERLYTLSGGGIHSHTISGPDTTSLADVEEELKKKGFLLGVNLSQKEIVQKIKEYGRVNEILLRHMDSVF